MVQLILQENCRKLKLVGLRVPGKRFPGTHRENLLFPGNPLVQITNLVVQIGTNHSTIYVAGKM